MQISPDLLIFMAILLCYIYVIMSAYFLHRKCNYIHETAVSIIFGVVLGAIIISFTDIFATKSYEGIMRQVIILILLPPMLFEDGYNIRKRKFFQNIMYINLYGILGTILHFLTLFGIIYAFNHYSLIRSVNNQPIVLEVWQILAMASCLCSIDTVVPEKIVNPERYPKLFSIIFGQSIFKDTITVTLFDSIINVYKNLSATNSQFNANAIGYLVLKFLEVIVGSILIGTASGLITTFLFKKFRFLIDEKGVAEVALIVLTGYGSYILSQWATFSGVISMLFCGITLSHFNVYNLTEEGKISAKISVSALAKVAEALLFFLLGAFIFGIQINQESDKSVDYTFSWSLLLITIFSLLTARFINVYLMSLIGYLVVGAEKWRLNAYEYNILFVSGLVKGAIPFALVLTLPTANHKFTTASIQNTVIVIVFFTSLFLNSLMPKFLRFMLKKIDQMIKTHQNHPSLYDSLLIQFQQKQIQIQKQSNFSSNRSDRSKQTQLERFQSKKQLQKIALLTKLKSTTQKYWRRCEEGFLKPLLIHDYYNRKQQIKMQKIKLRKEEAQQFWRKFTGENILDPENQEANRFVDVKLIENDEYSEDEDKIGNQIEQQEDGNLVCYIKKQKSNTKMEQEIIEIKFDKSKTQVIKPIAIEEESPKISKPPGKEQKLQQSRSLAEIMGKNKGKKEQQRQKKQPPQNAKLVEESAQLTQKLIQS